MAPVKKRIKGLLAQYYKSLELFLEVGNFSII
jgi:hypothetical protein